MWTQLSLTAVLAAAASLVNAAPVKYAIITRVHQLVQYPNIQARTIRERRVGFDWGSTKVRGVNIGGWLVLEP